MPQTRDQQCDLIQARLQAIKNENAKLKNLLAEAELDKAMLKEIAARNGYARR